MKNWQTMIVYLAAFLLQPFLYNLIPQLGAHINLLLCLTVMFTLLYDNQQGIFFGFVFGLLYDLFYGMYAGPGALCLVLCGLAALIIKDYINIENFFNGVLIMLVAVWLHASLYWVVYFFIGSPYSYIYAMKWLPLSLLFNGLIGAVIYLILIKRVIRHRRDRYFR